MNKFYLYLKWNSDWIQWNNIKDCRRRLEASAIASVVGGLFAATWAINAIIRPILIFKYGFIHTEDCWWVHGKKWSQYFVKPLLALGTASIRRGMLSISFAIFSWGGIPCSSSSTAEANSARFQSQPRWCSRNSPTKHAPHVLNRVEVWTPRWPWNGSNCKAPLLFFNVSGTKLCCCPAAPIANLQGWQLPKAAGSLWEQLCGSPCWPSFGELRAEICCFWWSRRKQVHILLGVHHIGRTVPLVWGLYTLTDICGEQTKPWFICKDDPRPLPLSKVPPCHNPGKASWRMTMRKFRLLRRLPWE